MQFTRQPFYLDGTKGKLFCIFFEPETNLEAITLIFPPFAEEMNKSRRMLSQQAGLLAGLGQSTLIFDLYGTGDSDGDFSEAEWGIWQDDITLILDFIITRGFKRINILAPRMGALLTTQIKAQLDCIKKVVYWQPVTNGELLLNQFYRLKLASDMLGKETGLTLKQIKEQVAQGNSIEIGGYNLNPALAAGLSKTKLDEINVSLLKDCHWIEILPSEDKSVPPGSQRIIDSISNSGAGVSVHSVVGPQFWSAVELVDIPELLTLTSSILIEQG